MGQLEKCKEDALYLLAQFPSEKATFHDERESVVHTVDQGVIELATAFVDYTTYFVSVQDGKLHVTKKHLDDYRRHEKARVIVGHMDDDDYAELAGLLGYFAAGVRSEKALQDVDLKDAARRLLDALFVHPALGARPARAPALKKNSYQIGIAINDVLKKAKRQAEFEWKEWAGDGVQAVNKLAPLKALGIRLAPPADAAADALPWFHRQLAQHDLMLVAIAPLDELQRFSLVDISGFNDLQEVLKLLNVHVEAPLE